MNNRTLKSLFDKWAPAFSDYQESLIVPETLKLIEHVLVFGIKKGLITSLKQVNDYLQMQMPDKKGAFAKPYFYIEVDTQHNNHIHSVFIPKLEVYPFGEILRALRCKAFHIGRVPAWEKNSNKIFLSEINDTISIVWDSLLDGFEIKSSIDFHFGLEEEDWEGWLEIENIDLHGAKVTGLRLRRLKTLQTFTKNND